MNRLIFEVAHQMALVPMLWLGAMRLRGHRRGVEWWWLAGIFLVSWLADTAADLAPQARVAVSVVYPLSQTALVGLVLFLERREALWMTAALAAVAVVAVLWRGVSSPDVFFRTVAWGTAVGIVVNRWHLGRLRLALLVAFGVGLLCWWAYALRPGWWSWSIYQSVRALGIGLFCWAALKPGPSLRLR